MRGAQSPDENHENQQENGRVGPMTASVHPGKPGGSGTRLASGLSAVLCLLLTACNGSGSRQAGTAPNMNGDAIPTMRNVADPNAPFTLRPETPHLVKRQPILDASALPVCAV
jgi:hypothetical protein